MKTALLLLCAALFCSCTAGSVDPIVIDLSKRTRVPTAPQPTATPAPTAEASRPSAQPIGQAAAPEAAGGSSGTVPGVETGYLYRATLVQAAPGKLLDLIDLYKSTLPSFSENGDESPLWMRHSQGDRWDLLLIFPMGNWSQYTSAERTARRHKSALSAAPALARLDDDVAWQEDVYVWGPPLPQTRAQWGKAGFFHVEMFEALPGKGRDLLREREMENAYSKRLRRPENLVFVRESGAAWSLFTIGCYRDLKHYAESAEIPEPEQESAAKAAGFSSTREIGPYLRTLIRQHHDTLAVAIP